MLNKATKLTPSQLLLLLMLLAAIRKTRCSMSWSKVAWLSQMTAASQYHCSWNTRNTSLWCCSTSKTTRHCQWTFARLAVNQSICWRQSGFCWSSLITSAAAAGCSAVTKTPWGDVQPHSGWTSNYPTWTSDCQWDCRPHGWVFDRQLADIDTRHVLSAQQCTRCGWHCKLSVQGLKNGDVATDHQIAIILIELVIKDASHWNFGSRRRFRKLRLRSRTRWSLNATCINSLKCICSTYKSTSKKHRPSVHRSSRTRSRNVSRNNIRVLLSRKRVHWPRLWVGYVTMETEFRVQDVFKECWAEWIWAGVVKGNLSSMSLCFKW